MAKFGETVKRARIAKGLSREDLSALSGVSVGTIITTERGRYLPRATTLYALAKHLEIDVNKLLFELEQEGNKRKNGIYYLQLQEFLKEKQIAQKRYAEILGKSWSYLILRLISDQVHFDSVDIQKTRDYFKLSPDEVLALFIDHSDNKEVRDESV